MATLTADASPLKSTETEIETLAHRVVAGERRALARAITLAESTRADHRAQTLALFGVLRRAGVLEDNAVRIGLSGAPGVGKSTFIEAFGGLLTGLGKRVAVLAVDPSSALTGGSILGDKTRMETLSRDPNAFIRPSPSGATLGGVARRSREAIALCGAAGFDVVLVETVGVGQSETMVADMTDVFLLLLAPGGGDDLQGVKRGVMELADLVIVNKADGDLAPAAERTRADYAGALRLLRRRPGDPDNIPSAMAISALHARGVEEVWKRVAALDDWRREAGWRERRRREQAVRAFEAEVEGGALDALRHQPNVAAEWGRIELAVANAEITPEGAAAHILTIFLGHKPERD